MPDAHPTQIGKYQVTDLLGQGAMGVVYRALDPMLHRTVAIKVMSAGIASDAHLRDRFMREARAAGSLQHPNIITIFDFGEVDGQLYIAMEYLEGADLSEMIERRDPLPIEAKLDIVIDVLHALDYAHARQIVHRDIKPDNIRVSVDGRAKLMDFGIARLEASNLTQSGMLIGTPHYMAPEQVTGGAVGPPTDVFAVGVVLYELLTLRKAFDGEMLHSVLYKVVSEQPAPLGTVDPGIPRSLQALIDQALAKEPAARFQSAGDMARALSAVRIALSGASAVAIQSRVTPLLTIPGAKDRPPRPRKRPIWAAAGGAVVIVAAVAVLVPWRARAPQADGALPLAASPSAVSEATSAAPAPGREPRSAGAGPAPQAAAKQPQQDLAASSRTPAAPARDTAPTGPPASQTQPAAAPPQTRPQATPPDQPAAGPESARESPAAAQPGDPRPDLEQLVAAYARAIEARSVSDIRRVYPGMTGAQQQGWDRFFQTVPAIRARLSLSRLEVHGATADLAVAGTYEYEGDGGRAVQQPVSFQATAVLEGGAWRLRTVR